MSDDRREGELGPDEVGDLLAEFLEEITGALALDARVAIEVDGDMVTGTLEGEDLGLFIGRHGQTIDAVQHLAQRVCLRESRGPVRVVVDAAGYRDRRAEALRTEADEAADEAVRAGRPVELDAMSSSERRVVHEYLREREDVETYSEGQEPDRRLVVTPRVEEPV